MAAKAGREFFDAVKYSKTSKQQRQTAFQILSENYHLIFNLPCPAKVLDIGCGSGGVSQLLACFTNLSPIVGADQSLQMIELARKTTSDERFQFHQWAVDDTASMPEIVREGGFSLATAFAVMHWISRQTETLANVFQVLRPGGYFIAQLVGKYSESLVDLKKFYKQNPGEFRQYIKADLTLDHNHQPWMDAPHPQVAYRALLEKAGFAVVKCHLVTTPYYYSDQELRAFMNSMIFQQVEGLPESLRDPYEEMCFKMYTKNVKQTESGYWLREDERIFVVAKKP